jgi:hypothetical protein
MNKLGRKIREQIVAHTGDVTNVKKYLSGVSEGKKSIRRLGVMGDNIKKSLKKRREILAAFILSRTANGGKSYFTCISTCIS